MLQNQANFAKTYVHNQLAEQQIVFTPVAALTAEEKQARCLVDYAGQPLTTGKQAECYANHYIGLHVTLINDGKTYSPTSTAARGLQAQATAALARTPRARAASRCRTRPPPSAKATSLFQGETLRGLLLTSYGFSIFGERAEQAAWVAYLAALVLLLASLAGFVHAFSTSKNRFVMVEHDTNDPNGSNGGPKPTDEPTHDGPVLAGSHEGARLPRARQQGLGGRARARAHRRHRRHRAGRRHHHLRHRPAHPQGGPPRRHRRTDPRSRGRRDRRVGGHRREDP